MFLYIVLIYVNNKKIYIIIFVSFLFEKVYILKFSFFAAISMSAKNKSITTFNVTFFQLFTL